MANRQLPLPGRRAILTLSALGAAGAGLWLTLRKGSVGRWLRPPAASPTAEFAPLTARTRQTLRIATRWVIGHEVELADYDDYFAWRALHVPEAGARCEAFAERAEAEARAAHTAAFALCGEGEQDRILSRLVHLREHQAVRDDILRRFARTDAWIAIGYDSHPGVPRGLDDYLKPLPGARGG